MRLWASTEAVSLVGPGVLQILEDGQLFTTAGEHLYVHDRYGSLLHRVSTESLGSARYVGPLLALDENTVIMRNDRRIDDSLKATLSAVSGGHSSAHR